MRVGGFIHEAAASTVAARGFAVANTLAILVAAIAVYLTVGQTAALEAEVGARLRTPAARLIVVDAQRAALTTPTTSLIALAARDDVDAVLAVGAAVDTANQAAPEVTPFIAARPAFLVDSDERLLALVGPGGRQATASLPASYQARMPLGLGGLILPSGQAVPVMGTYQVEEVLSGRLQTALVWTDPDSPAVPFRSIYILAATVDDVGRLAPAIPSAIGIDDPLLLTVETPRVLNDVGRAVEGTLGTYSRALLIGAVGFAFIWVAVTTWAWAYTRRRDIGRRRALGATRTLVAGLIIAQVAVSATLATLAGFIVHLVLAGVGSTLQVPTQYGVAVALLLAISAVAAALVPALVAARRDPIRVLRIP